MDRIEERIFHQAEFVQNLTWEMLPEYSHTVLGHGTVMSSGALVAEALTEKTSTKDLYEALLLIASLPEVSVWQAVFDGSGLHDAYGKVVVKDGHLVNVDEPVMAEKAYGYYKEMLVRK